MVCQVIVTPSKAVAPGKAVFDFAAPVPAVSLAHDGSLSTMVKELCRTQHGCFEKRACLLVQATSVTPRPAKATHTELASTAAEKSPKVSPHCLSQPDPVRAVSPTSLATVLMNKPVPRLPRAILIVAARSHRHPQHHRPCFTAILTGGCAGQERAGPLLRALR
jgi:hypothetical protein